MEPTPGNNEEASQSGKSSENSKASRDNLVDDESGNTAANHANPTGPPVQPDTAVPKITHDDRTSDAKDLFGRPPVDYKGKERLPESFDEDSVGSDAEAESQLPFKCPICPRHFATKGALTRHSKTHGGSNHNRNNSNSSPARSTRPRRNATHYQKTYVEADDDSFANESSDHDDDTEREPKVTPLAHRGRKNPKSQASKPTAAKGASLLRAVLKDNTTTRAIANNVANAVSDNAFTQDGNESQQGDSTLQDPPVEQPVKKGRTSSNKLPAKKAKAPPKKRSTRKPNDPNEDEIYAGAPAPDSNPDSAESDDMSDDAPFDEVSDEEDSPDERSAATYPEAGGDSTEEIEGQDASADEKKKRRSPNATKRGIAQDLPPLSNLKDIFQHMGKNAMEKLKFKTVTDALRGREVRVATICSGTESPLLAMAQIDSGKGSTGSPRKTRQLTQ